MIYMYNSKNFRAASLHTTEHTNATVNMRSDERIKKNEVEKHKYVTKSSKLANTAVLRRSVRKIDKSEHCRVMAHNWIYIIPSDGGDCYRDV